MTRVFDQMATVRAKAMVAGQNPIGWKLNNAALSALREEKMIDDTSESRAVEERPLFGLPVIVDPDDQSGEPHFILLKMKPTTSGSG